MDKGEKCCFKKVTLTKILHSALQMKDNTSKVLCDLNENVMYCKVIFAMSICLCL